VVDLPFPGLSAHFAPFPIYPDFFRLYPALMPPNELTHAIIGAAIEVHREIGPGKVEAAYEVALCRELNLRGIAHHSQKPLPVIYKGKKLDCGYRLDALVADTVVVEAKSVEAVHPVHKAQVLTYLKLGGWRWALLLNFNVAVLKEGIERLVLGFGTAPSSEASGNFLKTFGLDECTAENFRATSNSGDRKAEALAGEIIASALEVHREFGPGLLPSAYEACLCHELHSRGVPFQRNCPLR